MVTTPKYDADVQRNIDKLRGNISSVKMTPEECQAEIAAVQDGAKSSFEREEGNKGETGEFTAKFGLGRVPHNVKYEISSDGKSVNIEAPHTDIMGNLGTLQLGQSVTVTGIPEKLQPQGYVTKSGRIYKSKPGRRPKDAKVK